jgi:hypothetical protein
MKLVCGLVTPSLLASLCFLALATAAPAQVAAEKTPSPTAGASSSADAAALQKKANEAQARIHGNEDETGQLRRAIKLNEVALAREVLLRNGFTVHDLENAKINLRTGGGKNGEDQIEISVTCCDAREITIRRTLESR